MVAAIIVLMAVSFAVRFYNFDQWLYFKMDQARDAILITNVLENGPGSLPLLGPRAGATEVDNGYLRLGPAYYYMQYIAGVLSGGNEPVANAYPDLFFSIAVLPLLYIFLRLYFRRSSSFLITAMYAFSFLIIEYSRFAWNPNTLPFFMILSFYGLLKFFRDKGSKKRKYWIMLWSLGLAIGSQLHFFGFFSLLGASGLMFLLYLKPWRKEELKTIFSGGSMKNFLFFTFFAATVFGLTYVPVIISDIYKKGENSRNFVQAIFSKPEKKPFIAKAKKGVEENLKYYCLLTTSQCYSGNINSKKNFLPAAITVIIFIAGIFLAFRKLRKENDEDRKIFVMLVLVWLGVFSILSIPVSFQLRPRFFIVVFALPFILLGFLFEFFRENFKRAGLFLSILLAVMIIGWNLRGTYKWFWEQKNSQLGDVEINRTLILKNKDGVTLGQLQAAVDFMYERHKPDHSLYYYVKPEHIAPVKFLLRQKDQKLVFDSMNVNKDHKAQFFAVVPTGTDKDPVFAKFKTQYSVLATKIVGQITVSEITFPDRIIDESFVSGNRENNETGSRVFWRDIFPSLDGTNSFRLEEDASADEEETEEDQ
ncbi:MAG TPA: phospholipid carrier-dependent glycosyltransferase [Candidatus Moranbacteria bacterium]|nr:phospholipid carrier-dependent glycosyltransferase [Candidatus Moranbacteria bacterium]HSA08405.1 phospholipid carrier-dependent glycosyltransferase [Candidatus Moranbacteria bacterium]